LYACTAHTASALALGLALRAKSGNRRIMKRPIAELLFMTLNAGGEAEQARAEHEAWQILRRKQGYVTHRIYQQLNNPLVRLAYSEWESTKAVDGARQHLQGTPLMRRARATLAGPPQRLVFEICGPITSTKGLDLAATAVAASGVARLKGPSDSWRVTEQKLWTLLASQPGHVTHVLLRGIADPLAVGSVSHWADAAAFQTALAQVDSAVSAALADALTNTVDYVLYKLLRD
jgi:heme-degrading monooxygenase HmoA